MVDIDRRAAENLGTAQPVARYARPAARERNRGAWSRATATGLGLKSSKSAAPADATAMIARAGRSLPAPVLSRDRARISARCSRRGRARQNSAIISSSVGTGSPAKAGRTRRRRQSGGSTAKESSRALPRPSVVRSSRSSCRRISSPSAVSRTSNSTQLQPSAWARRSPASVFSGAAAGGAAVPDHRRQPRACPWSRAIQSLHRGRGQAGKSRAVIRIGRSQFGSPPIYHLRCPDRLRSPSPRSSPVC